LKSQQFVITDMHYDKLEQLKFLEQIQQALYHHDFGRVKFPITLENFDKFLSQFEVPAPEGWRED
jgi:hypothetical protein